jgi:hypothetical protein
MRFYNTLAGGRGWGGGWNTCFSAVPFTSCCKLSKVRSRRICTVNINDRGAKNFGRRRVGALH